MSYLKATVIVDIIEHYLGIASVIAVSLREAPESRWFTLKQ